MAKPNSGGDFDKVRFKHVATDEFENNAELTNDEDDEVTIELKSLISENKPANGFSRNIKHSYWCNIQRLSMCALVVIGAVLFIAGLTIGLLIGRFSYDLNQSEESGAKVSPIAETNQCNCSRCSTEGQLSSTTPSSSPDSHTERYTTSSKQTTHSMTEQKFVTPVTSKSSTSSCNVCKTRDPNTSLGNESIRSLFAPITKKEMKAVSIALKTKAYVSYDHKLASNRLSHVYLLPPVKYEALHHLDKNSSFPGRFAKVHVFRPASDPPDVMEYRVGPLNETFENMIVEKLRKDGEISFNRRPYDSTEANELYTLLEPEIQAIAHLLFESFDGINNTKDTFPEFSYLPTSNLSDRTSYMVLVLHLGSASTLRLLPVSCTVHHPGTNVSRWYTSNWYYLDQGPYKSATELQEAYDSVQLRKIKYPTMYRKDHKGDFDRVRNESLPARDLSDIPPPRTYEPQGPRYTVKGHKVMWMGWQLEVSTNPVRGPAVFDVRFQGERIAYEISLQDITLLYSTQTNGHGPPVLSDTFYLIGKYNKPVFDVDCPKRSKILKATHFLAGSPIEMDAFCVFEADGQRPLWRHGSRGLADHYLVIRAPISVGNYDYIFEWNFYLDGRLQTHLTASGYLYGAFWDPDDPKAADDDSFPPYGYRLGEFLLGPIHDHTFTFKIDLDIYGTTNSFQTVHWKTRSRGTQKPGYILFNNTRYASSEILTHENSFILDTKNPKVWTVVNENKRNSWGAKKGYRVIPHSKYAEILEDHMMLQVWDHLKYQLAVTKRKESEPYATNSLYDITHPIKMFPRNGVMKLDNETVRNEDLVLWISEKFYHLPTSEDVPMTLPAEVGFTLKPFNYFDRTPVFDLPAHYSKHEAYDNTSCFVND
ncbi:amiloride-sensitive amine oxidase [copper-containing]-like isoform X2 [Mercenaria mercenaria]|nr:amiloride-sensitive amine oxidase [copper-containing]-like isoform X2 [Mercenaria mercenaria]XP_045169449.2 amiloride-sensitive amine oxidase [copper-containing]-like isoform X2 [Mercenaria mercenaria]